MKEMKNIPPKIYLNIGDSANAGIDDFKDLYEVTWCEDRIESGDIAYVREPFPRTVTVEKILDILDIKLWPDLSAEQRVPYIGGKYQAAQAIVDLINQKKEE
jgi:hypothetical protein